MSTFVLCVGCGTPLYGFSPCQWCTYELCGNDLRDGFCSLCNSRNSCVYDPNPNSFDCPPDSCHPPHPTYETYSCDSYGNDSHFGYDCQPQFPLNYESEPGYIKNYNSYPYDSSSFPQQYPCCEDCGVLPEADHYQTPQYTINHPIFNAHNDLLNSQTTLMEQMATLTSMCEMVCQIVQKKQEEKKIEEEQAANAQYWKIPACCDDDDDSAITPNKPVDSLSMGDEHLDTIPAMESDEFIKSSVENLVPNPSEFEGKNGCDSCSDEDFPEETYSNPLFEEEINSMRIDQHHFNAESDLIESMLNHDSSIIPSSSKINSLLDEFAGELTLIKSIPPGINETDCYSEEDIRLIERLLYDNSSPRPPKEFVSKNSNADIESFSPSPILIEDSDSFMEEIDLTLTPDDPMLPGIKEDEDDSERDILIHEEFLDNYFLSLPVNGSFHFDIPSFSRPPAKPPDGNTGILNIKMMGDISDQKFPIPNLMITLVSNQEKSPDLLSHRSLEIFQPSAKCPMMIHGKNIPILDYSRKFEDSCQRILSSKSSFPQLQLGIMLEYFDYILVLCGAHFILIFLYPLVLLQNHQMEKSPDLLSHRGFENFQPSAECPMKIHGKNIPTLDVPRFHFYPP
nr:pre-mRNA splicing Prp18-interacting factor [Tanacetum cinerariifolium]